MSKPAGAAPKVTIYPDGTRIEEWRVRDQLHRAGDKPAYVETRPDGTRFEAWWLHDQRHRAGDKPAYVGTCPDGTRVEQWWRHGVNVIRRKDAHMKLCVDCKWHEYCGSSNTPHTCCPQPPLRERVPDPVVGGMCEDVRANCYFLRLTHCGPTAKWFEPKEKK